MPARKKSKKTRRVILALLIIFFLCALAGVFYLNRSWFCKKKIRYSQFGISLPADYTVHGIDVSRYQYSIDWRAVADMKVGAVKIDFAFIKATEGRSYTDPYFRANWRQIENTRLIRGAYHFFNPNVDGLVQAENFINRVKLKPGDLPPVLDVEVLEGISPKQLVKGVRQWIDRVQAHYKVKPIIYSGADFYSKYLSDEFSEYPLWVAHYYEPCAPRVRSNWVFWQHNDRGQVSGIGARVDFNVFHGSRAALDSLCILTTMR